MEFGSSVNDHALASMRNRTVYCRRGIKFFFLAPRFYELWAEKNLQLRANGNHSI